MTLDTYFAALEAYAEADRRQHAAQVSGDIDARERADFDRDVAMGQVYRAKEDAAGRLMFAIRAAEELFPGRLRDLLGVADVESAMPRGRTSRPRTAPTRRPPHCRSSTSTSSPRRSTPTTS